MRVSERTFFFLEKNRTSTVIFTCLPIFYRSTGVKPRQGVTLFCTTAAVIRNDVISQIPVILARSRTDTSSRREHGKKTRSSKLRLSQQKLVRDFAGFRWRFSRNSRGKFVTQCNAPVWYDVILILVVPVRPPWKLRFRGTERRRKHAVDRKCRELGGWRGGII